MTEILVERLRKYRDSSLIYPSTFGEAADALEEQAARIAALEAALKQLIDTAVYSDDPDTKTKFALVRLGDLRAARAALGKDDNK